MIYMARVWFWVYHVMTFIWLKRGVKQTKNVKKTHLRSVLMLIIAMSEVGFHVADNLICLLEAIARIFSLAAFAAVSRAILPAAFMASS